ncbi:hypothetical protein [Bradyrhizobium ivorense]|uniref:hypothetical protein n=1 Tax=Bradyrhizobium ivorense TaxID=2511166 RepID=UPI0010B613D4|nr:hypothetical protein [Bradyrhizobium ivorense]VIO75196.1 hypothetical protein CI41S_47010 [Bradyrhizobium ivorense]
MIYDSGAALSLPFWYILSGSAATRRTRSLTLHSPARGSARGRPASAARCRAGPIIRDIASLIRATCFLYDAVARMERSVIRERMIRGSRYPGLRSAPSGLRFSVRGKRDHEVAFTLSGPTMKYPNSQSVILTLLALWILWSFGFQTLWARYATELDGVVVSSLDKPSKGAPRYATEYVVRDASNHDTPYVAGPTDAFLERSIPVGSRIEKKWGQLGYRLDDRWRSFPVTFYSAVMGAAFFMLFWAALVQWRTRE